MFTRGVTKVRVSDADRQRKSDRCCRKTRRKRRISTDLVQIASAELHEDVQQVDDVDDGVKSEPAGVAGALHLAKGLSQDARPQIVQHRHRHHAQPVEHEVAIVLDREVPGRLERPAR